MGKKFTSEDLFRIAKDNLSAQESVEFRFDCLTKEFRETVGTIFSDNADISKDERNLLERIFRKIGFVRGSGR